jgi:hypothetical protein
MGTFLLIFGLIGTAITIFMIAANWKIYTKARQPGWASIVPIYNTIILLRIVGKPAWWFILLLIPGINLIFAIIILNELSNSFGKGSGFTLGLLFLPFIFFPMLGFGDASYVGPSGLRKD